MRFAGYAAIFDAPDSGGDIVRKGAFTRAAKAGVPLLRQHDAARRIGFVEALEEDERGLRVIATLDDGEAVAAGAGLSFGYRVCGMERGTYRELTDLDLIEVSVVSHPMQPLARVLAVTIFYTGTSTMVTVNGVATSGWTLTEGGVIEFETAPEEGADVTAGFLFDVPVRFAEDRIEVNRATFGAGDMPSVPLVEIRE